MIKQVLEVHAYACVSFGVSRRECYDIFHTRRDASEYLATLAVVYFRLYDCESWSVTRVAENRRVLSSLDTAVLGVP